MNTSFEGILENAARPSAIRVGRMKTPSPRRLSAPIFMIKTEQEIRDAFRRAGVSISKWAQIRGFSTNMVYDVLSGRRPANRGQCHQIAVALGMKEGEITDAKDFDPRAARPASRRECKPNTNERASAGISA
uniref:Phage-associated protein, BcepMu gp16 family n=1 Tax=Candidatus Kentrum sp. LPFa TaxID=2126335 RepID=A0A450WTP0_9GAMM|nr:MAG: phage-associated protein, BcepMu gp16 family [Candidatus Kentron sp. LPFa]